MANLLGPILRKARKTSGLTQDDFGAKYSISGPAVSKFEQGFVSPSLQLWLRMAADADLAERAAVLLWAKNRLPLAFRPYLEINRKGDAPQDGKKKPPAAAPPDKKKKVDYAAFAGRGALLGALQQDPDAPKGLIALMADDMIWGMYTPSGAELTRLRDVFAPLGQGSKEQYRQALRLLREFT